MIHIQPGQGVISDTLCRYLCNLVLAVDARKYFNRTNIRSLWFQPEELLIPVVVDDGHGDWWLTARPARARAARAPALSAPGGLEGASWRPRELLIGLLEDY